MGQKIPKSSYIFIETGPMIFYFHGFASSSRSFCSKGYTLALTDVLMLCQSVRLRSNTVGRDHAAEVASQIMPHMCHSATMGYGTLSATSLACMAVCGSKWFRLAPARGEFRSRRWPRFLACRCWIFSVGWRSTTTCAGLMLSLTAKRHCGPYRRQFGSGSFSSMQ